MTAIAARRLRPLTIDLSALTRLVDLFRPAGPTRWTIRRLIRAGRAREAHAVIARIDDRATRQTLLADATRRACDAGQPDEGRAIAAALLAEYVAEGRSDAVLALCDQMLAHDRYDSVWHRRRAAALIELGRIADARQALNAAWQYAPAARRPAIARIVATLPVMVARTALETTPWGERACMRPLLAA